MVCGWVVGLLVVIMVIVGLLVVFVLDMGTLILWGFSGGNKQNNVQEQGLIRLHLLQVKTEGNFWFFHRLQKRWLVSAFCS